MPFTALRKVLLPQPLGPMMAVTFPLGRPMLKSWSIVRRPRQTTRFRTVMASAMTHTSFRKRNKKNGAPMKAMMMPTGNSAGARISRAAVSLKVTVATPRMAAPGMR